MSTRVLTLAERAAAILRDPEQKVVHPDVATPLASLIENATPSATLNQLTRVVIHAEHEATYSPTE